MTQRTKTLLFRTVRFVILLFALTVFFLPLVSMFVTSLKTQGELYVYPPKLLPESPQWRNYVEAWTLVRFGKYLINSLIISTFYAVPVILSSCFAGYAFSRFQVRENRAVFMVMLATMMIPFMVTIIPLYLILAKMRLVDKRWLWILFGLQGIPFLIFLFRQYFSTIPLSFEESARLEGAGRFQVFFRIMFPLVQTGVVIAAIFAFQWSWSNYEMPVLFLTGEKVTLAVRLSRGYVDIKENILHNIGMAGIVYYTAPIMIAFFALQKRFISGLLAGGLKG